MSDTKSIHEFLAENPDVDVSRYWDRCYTILTDVKNKIAEQFTDLTLDPGCAGREYYTSPNGEFEGSFQAWSSKDCDWLVNSWLGNRKASILDMNATCFPSAAIDVPNFVMVFGTIPSLFFYFDFTPRRNLMVDTDYLDTYYQPINEEYLALRGNTNFQWNVSHGTYMRGMVNPSTQSLTAELNDENIDILEEYAYRMLDHWLGWVKNAKPVPQEEQASLQAYSHKIRKLGYERDPMNALAENVFGKDQVQSMLDLRMGKQQMANTKLY